MDISEEFEDYLTHLVNRNAQGQFSHLVNLYIKHCSRQTPKPA